MRIKREGEEFTVVEGHDGFWKIFADGSWEPHTFKIFDQFLRADQTFLDIGSWIGPTVLYAASRARRVFAFEPDPVAFRSLTQNIELNQIANVVPYPVAVSDRWKALRLGIKGQLGDSMTSELWAGRSQTSKVAAISLESVILDLQPSFVKIDIEGGERAIFDGCQLALQECKPTIHLSLHTPWFKDNIEELQVPIMEGLSMYPYFYSQNLKRIELEKAFDPGAFNSIVATFKEL